MIYLFAAIGVGVTLFYAGVLIWIVIAELRGRLANALADPGYTDGPQGALDA